MLKTDKRGKRAMIWFVYGAAAAAVIAICLLLAGCFIKSEVKVGKDIKNQDITEFYCIYSSSTNPPRYYQYHFFIEDDEFRFYCEKREGDHFPLTDKDITSSNGIRLDEEQWLSFLDCINDGSVTQRENSAESGEAGPWYTLYWNGDDSKYRDFSFSSHEKENEFNKLCEALARQKQ